MPAEPGGVVGTPSSVPIPDPTTLTTNQIDRAVNARTELVNAQFDTIRQRLDDMDKANTILSENVNRVPTSVQLAVGSLKELHGVRFDSFDKQFETLERQRVNSAVESKEALAAALAAAKELVSVQNTSNTQAIQKSEASTIETINKLAQLVDVNIKGLGDQIQDLKERVLRNENLRVGSTVERNERRLSNGAMAGIFSAGAAVLGIILAIVAFVIANKP